MKTLWSSLCLLLLSWPLAAAQRDQISVRAQLDAQRNVIEGVTEIRYYPRSVPLHDLRFRLYPNLFATDSTPSSITVDSVSVNGIDLSAHMAVDTTDLWVRLPDSIPADSGATARLVFQTKIPARADRFGLCDDQYTLEAWFPYPAPWYENRWERVRYRPFLEPAANLSDIHVDFTYPDSLQLIAAGLVRADTAQGTVTANLSLNRTVDLPLILSGHRFELDTTRYGNTNVRIYFREDDSYMVDSARSDIFLTMDYMSERVLPYPFEELTVVLRGLTVGGGLEMPRMVLIGRPPRTVTDRNYSATIIHEVIHQWFFGLVASNQANHPWMDEAITEYFSTEVGRSRYGDKTSYLDVFGVALSELGMKRISMHGHFDLLPVTHPSLSYFDDLEYYETIYAKGSLVVGTLVNLMGNENGRKFWREYTENNKFGSPRPYDFFKLADKYLPENSAGGARSLLDCNVPLDWQVLELSNERVSDSADDSLAGDSSSESFKVRVDYAAVHPLGFPVTLRVTLYDGTVRDTTLVPRPGHHRVEVTTTGPARSAVLDPDQVYAVEANLLNNSLDNTGARGVALRLFSGLTFLVESLFSALWGW